MSTATPTNRITYYGHSTVGIETPHGLILTDPVLSDSTLLGKRLSPLSADRPSLKPKVILITQGHYDHLDLHSFKFFDSSVLILAPLGVGAFLKRFLNNPIEELAPHDKRSFDGFEIQTFPTLPWTFRLSGITLTNALGYWIQFADGKKVFFSGHMSRSIASLEEQCSFQNPDVALIAVEPMRPKLLTQRLSLSFEEAFTVAKSLGAAHFIPLHWSSCPKDSHEPSSTRLSTLATLESLAF